MEDLATYLKGRKCKEFKPFPHYFKDGDFISVFFKDDRCYAKQINPYLSIYYSMKTGEIVGCDIDGAKQLIKKGV